MAILEDRQTWTRKLRENSNIRDLTNTMIGPEVHEAGTYAENPNAATGNVIATSDSSQQITETWVSVV